MFEKVEVNNLHCLTSTITYFDEHSTLDRALRFELGQNDLYRHPRL